MAKDVGWNWVDTNYYGKTGKEHLLHMRREGLVQYEAGTSIRVHAGIGRRPYQSELLANWYTITFAGLQKLLELWADDDNLKGMARFMIRCAFNPETTYWERELKHRSPKKT